MIETISELSYEVPSEKSRLVRSKGIALQHIVRYVFKQVNRDLEQESSIRNVLKKLSKEEKVDYVVNKDFIFNGEVIKKHSFLTYEQHNYVKEHLKELYSEFVKVYNLDKIIDHFYYDSKKKLFIILESKNKEKTYFGLPDMYTTMPYARILNNNGFKVNNLIFVYNGEFAYGAIKHKHKFERYGACSIVFFDIYKHILENYPLFRGIKVIKENNKNKYLLIEGEGEGVKIWIEK